MKRTKPSLRNFRLRSQWLLAILLSACSVHEHDLTPNDKDAQGNTIGMAGAAGNGVGGASGTSQGGAAGTTQGGVAGTGGMPDGSAGTRDSGATDSPDTGPDGSISDGSIGDPDVAAEGSISDATLDRSTDATSDAVSDRQDAVVCIPDCPPTVCGTVSNNCGGTLACGPCQISSTFTDVAGVTLTTPRYAAAVARIGNFIYVVGGLNNGTYLPSVERASIDSKGNLSSFSDAGVSLVMGRSGHTALFVNQQLYVVGGASIAYTPTVERSTVDGNGYLSAFATVSGVTLTTARGAHGSTVIGHNDYIIGGNGDTALDSVESATFSNNGDLSTFTPVTGITLSTKRVGFASVSVGHWLYVIGGTADIPTDAGSMPGYLDSFERAPFDLSSLTGTFGALPSVSLAVPRYKLAAFAFGPNLYAIGGTNGVSGALATVEQGTINTNGDVTGPFAVSGTFALSSPRVGAVYVVVPPWLYAIGGLNNAGYLNTVERASIQ